MKMLLKKIRLIVVLIILMNTSAFSQAVNKPSIMVFPTDVWMNQNGYMKEIDNQGVKMMIPDYASALLNQDLSQVITKIETLMGDRGYPLQNYLKH